MDGMEGADDLPVMPIVEEPEEEPFINPVDTDLWYDYKAHNGNEPILLALMIKVKSDEKDRNGKCIEYTM